MSLERPRLLSQVLPRRHLIDGDERVALHDSERGSLALIAASDWSVIALADGTRTQREIVAATTSTHAAASSVEVAKLFEELFDLGLVVDGPSPVVATDAPVGAATEWMNRPLDVLSDYALSCDGRGGCCSQYSSIVLTENDHERAMKAGLRSRESGRFTGEALLPFSGTRSSKRALPIVDGGCAELTDDGRCSLHERGGAEAKPVACSSFPRTFVDDGEVIRVSIACECACVFRSSGLSTRPGEALVAAGALDGRAISEDLSVRVVPEMIAVVSGVFASRSDVITWSKRALAEPVPEEIVGRLVAEADALGAVARDAARAAGAPIVDAPGDPLTRELASFRERARAAAASAESWRSVRDRTRIMRRHVADAAEQLSTDGRALAHVMTLDTWRSDEAFFYRASLHGHLFVDGSVPLVDALQRAAIAVLVARALGATGTFEPHPLAAVLAMVRGTGR